MREVIWLVVLAVVMFIVAVLVRGQTTVTMGGQYRVTSSAKVTWTASVTPSVTYSIYRGKTGGPYTLVVASVACCQYVDKQLPAGKQVCYVVTAVDASLNESAQSNPEACGQVP